MRTAVMTLVMVLAAVLCCCAAAAEPAGGSLGDVTWWTDDLGNMWVGGEGPIPDFEQGGAPWSGLADGILTLSILDGVTRVGDWAFAGMENLRGVSYGAGLTDIGDCAFRGDLALGNPIFPDGLQRIGAYAFSGCQSVGGVEIPDALTDIDPTAFLACVSILTFEAPAEHPAFRSADGILFSRDGTELLMYPAGRSEAYYTVPEGVTRIGDGAFFASKLVSVTIPDSVTSVGVRAFSSSRSLSYLTLPAGITEISDECFTHSLHLHCITIPEGVTSIGNSAFGDCAGLTGITIPLSVTGVAQGAFLGAVNLTDVWYPGTAAQWDRIAIAEYNGPFSRAALHLSILDGGSCGTRGGDVLWVLDADGVFSLRGAGSMCDCTSGGAPWYGLRESITALNVEDGVCAIGAYAFSNCTALAAVSLAPNLSLIGNSAFLSCRGLTSVTFPWGLRAIGDSAFYMCSHMTELIFSPEGAPFTPSLETIGVRAFANCGALVHVTLPDSVTEIGDSAFAYCSGLTGLDLPSGITAIPDRMCARCTRLAAIAIPEGVTSIGVDAFPTSIALAEIWLPLSLRSVGQNAFGDRSRSMIVHYAGTRADWSGVAIADGNGTLTNARFHFVPVNILTLPEDLTEIGPGAFAELPEADGIRLPGSIMTIAADAFDPDTVLIVPAGSPWIAWAGENGYFWQEE